MNTMLVIQLKEQPEQELEASTWVQLRELPSPYSHDEALLLCQHSENEWVVWIPEYVK